MPILRRNVERTIALYRQAWNKSGEDVADVWFLDDNECAAVIAQVEPRLVPYFKAESTGPFKSDICRVAALYQQGGYYMDVDLQVIEPFVVASSSSSSCVSLVTARMPQRPAAFFQALLFSTARHPVLCEALQLMLQYYQRCEYEYGQMRIATDPLLYFAQLQIQQQEEEKERKGSNQATMGALLGTSIEKRRQELVSKYKGDVPAFLSETRAGKRQQKRNGGSNKLRSALKKWQQTRLAASLLGPSTLYQAYEICKNNNNNNQTTATSILLDEMALGTDDYPNLPRQVGRGRYCNFVVHDHRRPYFFSRVVGASPALCMTPLGGSRRRPPPPRDSQTKKRP